MKMKISLNQLETVLYKMKYGLLGYSKDKEDLDIEVFFTQEDPGTGMLTDCLTIEAKKPAAEGDEGETSMSVEIYPVNAGTPPRASKTESFPITKKY